MQNQVSVEKEKDKDLWWLGIIQGSLALLLGFLLVFSRNTASLWIGILAAVYLLVTGVVQTSRGLAMKSAGRGTGVLARGIVGLVTGGILLIMAWLDWGSLGAGYTILAIGLLIFGGLGLFVSLFQRGHDRFEWGPVLVNLALLAWGFLIFFSRSRDFDLASVSGWILIAVGAIVLIWTFVTRDEAPDDPAAVP